MPADVFKPYWVSDISSHQVFRFYQTFSGASQDKSWVNVLALFLNFQLSFPHLYYLQEQWRSSTPGSKRRERSENDDDEVGHSEKRRRKGGKRRKKDKSSRSHYETEYAEADMMDYREEPEDEDASMNYREPIGQMNDQDDDVEENANDRLAAAGLEDSDVDDEMVIFYFQSYFWTFGYCLPVISVMKHVVSDFET